MEEKDYPAFYLGVLIEILFNVGYIVRLVDCT